MHKLGRFLVTLAVFILSIWWTVAAIEAGKEIWALCGNFAPGVSAGNVVRTLDTGHFLQYRTRSDQGARTFLIDSRYNLHSSSCEVTVTDTAVVSSEFTEQASLPLVAGWVATAGMGALAVFQLLLAAGAPLGRSAWGGEHTVLPPKLRVGSLVSAVILVFGTVCVLEEVGLIEVLGQRGVAEAAVSVLAVIFALSTFANTVSRSPIEQWLMTPLALVLSCACVAVALA